MIVITFYHDGNPPSQIPMRGTLTILGHIMIVASRDNHRLDILANYRNEGGKLLADYHRIDLFGNVRQVFEGNDHADFVLQFSHKIDDDVFKKIERWVNP